MSSSTLDKCLDWFTRDRIPVVKVLIVANALTFFAGVFANLRAIEQLVVFEPAYIATRIWTLVTYPLWSSSSDPISLLFACYWLWIAGGSLERTWGSARFAGYFLVMSGLSAAGLLAASILLRIGIGAAGLWLPLAGVTISFAAMDPEQQILLFFVLPLKLKYLALLDVILVFVSYGRLSPLCGVFALTGCIFSYAYVRSGLWSAPRYYAGGMYAQPARRRESILRRLNPIKWYREYRMRKRLRDLFDK